MHQRWLVDEENLLPHQFLNITHILFFPILTQNNFLFSFWHHRSQSFGRFRGMIILLLNRIEGKY